MEIKFFSIDAYNIKTWESFHRTFKEEFSFPDYYGNNMDAWIDCMSEVVQEEVLCLIKVTNVQSLREVSPTQYHALLECTSFINKRLEGEGKQALLGLLLVE